LRRTTSKTIPPNMIFVIDPSGKVMEYQTNEFTQGLLVV
jgi:hypothetical protein